MNKLSLIKNAKGRFFGLTTRDGRVFNAQLRRETPFYIRFWDRNSGVITTVAKANIESVSLG